MTLLEKFRCRPCRRRAQLLRFQRWQHFVQVENVTAFQTSEREGAIAMLHGASLPGVGPVTAGRLADHYGAKLTEVMDAPDAAGRLAKVKGIGTVTAKRIKAAWDNSKGVSLA